MTDVALRRSVVLARRRALHKSVEAWRAATGEAAEFCDTPAMSIVGDSRVSTGHQLPDQQCDALTAAGCERVFTEKLHEVREDRPGLKAILDYVRPGDTVVASPWTGSAGRCPA